MINQVSVFIQNQEGKLGHVLRVLADADVNIRSLNIAETADYGILRLILQDISFLTIFAQIKRDEGIERQRRDGQYYPGTGG